MTAITDLQKLIAIYIQQIQELETMWFELINERTMDTAVGVQLDGLGDIVGEERFGRNDDDYRVAIKGRIRLNLSNGTAEDIVAVIRSQLGEYTVELSEDSFPAHFEAFLADTINILGASVANPSTGPYALVHLQTLTVDVDGGGVQTVTFDAADFADITEATVQEVSTVLSQNLTGANAVPDNNRVLLRSDTLGDDSSIQVTGGTANAVLNFDTDLHLGAEANQDLMIRVANNMTQARAAGVRGILLWNTSEDSFGVFGTPGALGFDEGEFASARDN
jgi:hypothetical protein